MSTTRNVNSGTLGRNDKKEKDSHPDHKGQLNVICPHCGQDTEFWLSAWVKTSTFGKFFSLSVTPKEKKK